MEITIQKPKGLVRVLANVPIKIKEMPKSRTFNMVPGVEALPLLVYFKGDDKKVDLSIEVV